MQDTDGSIVLSMAASKAREQMRKRYDTSELVIAATVHDPTVILRPQHLYTAASARIDSFVKLECGEGMLLGEHVHIASFCHLGIGGGITILEDGSSFASGSKIITGSNMQSRGRSCSAVAPGNLISKSFVHIGRDAVLFAGATILPGVTIGENAVIAAGALVREDVPALEVWAGVPACKIGELA